MLAEPFESSVLLIIRAACTRAAMRTKDMTLIEWPQPCRVLIGAHDRNGRDTRTQVLRDQGLPIELTIIENAADLSFYTHADLVLDAIEVQFNGAREQASG